MLENQEILPDITDTYKLRIWISDDVIYSNTVDGQDNQESIGKYNSYKYSLKVKVTSGTQTSIEFKNISISGKTMNAELNDPNGLDSYAITTSAIAPEKDSSEWIEITDNIAKSKVKRMGSNNVNSTVITHTFENDGIYYLHVRNKINQASKKQILIGKGSEQTISFDTNGGNDISSDKVISFSGEYGDLPTPTKNGYVFTGWYTSTSCDQAITASSVYNKVTANKLYACWQNDQFTLTINPNEGTYEGSTGETSYILEYKAEKNIPNPTRVGYTFSNWTVTGSESAITNGVFKMEYENSSLKANWTINSYTLTVNPDGGTWNSSTKCNSKWLYINRCGYN